MLLLTFNAGENLYAIDSKWIVALIPQVELRSVPHAPPFLAGLLAYRGRVVPVIDLGVLFARSPCHQRLSTRIILVSDASGDQNRRSDDQRGNVKNCGPGTSEQQVAVGLLGLMAEHVSDLTRIQTQQIIPAPVHLSETPYLAGMVQTGQGLFQLIAIDRVRDALLHGIFSGLDPALSPESSMEISSSSDHHELGSGSS